MGRVVRLVALLMGLTLLGALGLYWLEDQYSFLDALYMSIITLTTVGYDEVHPLSGGGRAFVMIYLILGLGVFLYCLTTLGELILSTQLRNWMGKRRMDSAVKSLTDHYIVCGFGRMGHTICNQLARRGAEFVVIDNNSEQLAECQSKGWHWLYGDASDDEILKLAGVARAKGLAAVLSTDADNLVLVFSARLLSASLRILARARDDKQIVKMEKAGADRVVSPYTAGANKIAQLLTNPHVEDFFEIVVGKQKELDLAEVHVSPDSPFEGKTLAETHFTSMGVVIVGIRKAGGELLLPPPSATPIESGDSLIALGNATAVQTLCSQT